MTKSKVDKVKDKKKKVADDFDKYFYYHASVQSPEVDVKFFRDTYKKHRGKKPLSLREDFCGTFAICCEWAKLNNEFQAYGIDLDEEPIEYGKANYLSELKSSQQERVHIFNKNVMDKNLPKTDIIAALNFSYFIFKKRQDLVTYFSSCHRGLNDKGLFILDCFGGPHCQEQNEEVTEHDGFKYYWDQDSFDPITNEALFHIHFKRKGEKKREQVFTYDWRMWSIPELKDILEEAGFSKVNIYWEDDDEDGDGNGEFQLRTQGEECDAWVAYLIAEK